jgi:hypothetical protein
MFDTNVVVFPLAGPLLAPHRGTPSPPFPSSSGRAWFGFLTFIPLISIADIVHFMSHRLRSRSWDRLGLRSERGEVPKIGGTARMGRGAGITMRERVGLSLRLGQGKLVRELRKLVRGCEVCLREIRQSLSSVGVFSITMCGELGRKWH